jgi:RNA polymerase sigma factor (sigma-70 family)
MEQFNYDIPEIWEKFQEGDMEAFAHIYNQYVKVLYRYGTKLTSNEELVKDTIQEIFLDLYVNRKNNKTNPLNLKYYLVLAVKRNLIKKLKRLRRNSNEEPFNELVFEPEYSIEKKIIEDEQKDEKNRLVVNALKTIPPKQKEALYLRYNEGLDYDDISKILKISKESVRKQVYRALKKIRSILKKESFLYWLFLSKK